MQGALKIKSKLDIILLLIEQTSCILVCVYYNISTIPRLGDVSCNKIT
jgi:hypothetical protein